MCAKFRAIGIVLRKTSAVHLARKMPATKT